MKAYISDKIGENMDIFLQPFWRYSIDVSHSVDGYGNRYRPR